MSFCLIADEPLSSQYVPLDNNSMSPLRCDRCLRWHPPVCTLGSDCQPDISRVPIPARTIPLHDLPKTSDGPECMLDFNFWSIAATNGIPTVPVIQHSFTSPISVPAQLPQFGKCALSSRTATGRHLCVATLQLLDGRSSKDALRQRPTPATPLNRARLKPGIVPRNPRELPLIGFRESTSSCRFGMFTNARKPLSVTLPRRGSSFVKR